MAAMLNWHDTVVRRFAEACRVGDIAALRDALDADATAVCDGGGVVPAALGPVHGAQDVARLAAVLLCGQPDAELTIETVNGRTGLALRRAGRAVAVAGVGTAGSKVTAVWIVLNPAKLRGWHRRCPAGSAGEPLPVRGPGDDGAVIGDESAGSSSSIPARPGWGCRRCPRRYRAGYRRQAGGRWLRYRGK
jgi:RNA polymerase sigma-70 factor (ECF subfamily)